MKTRTFSPVRKAVVTFAAATLAVTLVACGSDDDSQGDPGSEDTSKEPDKFVIAAGGVGVYNATPYIAEVEGYFEEAGLEVTINQAGSNTLNLVVGGQADVGMIGATTALFPVPNGKETSLIYANDTLAGFTYFGSSDPDVKTVNDCKKVSTGATGTSTFSMASLVKQKAEASYEITPFTTPDNQLAALLSNKVDCTSGTLSFLQPSIDEGKVHLVMQPDKPETMPEGIPANAPGIGVWGLKDHLAEDRDVVVRFVGALSKATQFFLDHTDEEVAEVLRESSDFQAIPLDQLTGQVAGERNFLSTPPNGTIPESDWPAYLEFAKFSLPDIDPADSKWSYASRVDMSFLADAGK